jgi:transglutaminase elicitor
MYNPMNDHDLQNELDAFDQNPAQEMGRLPEKRNAAGALVALPFTAFSPRDLDDGQFVLQRDTVRKSFSTVVDGVYLSLEDTIPGKAPIEVGDRPENLVDNLRYVDLGAMEAAGLRQAALAPSAQPWSDDYWALYLGCLGRRYADPKFPGSPDWSKNRDYIRQHPAQQIWGDGAAAIDLLSPAEKYDLLVGDETGSLTSAMWAEGEPFFQASGEVESWMGICHGWAPASYMMPRPKQQVTVQAANGTPLKFYPADIKALASLLWASANTMTRFIGGRSNDKDPATDANGRVISPQAFDTNPGTWHLAIVNQLGVARRSLVMDATYDYEVWNQPVAGYEYRYFNPQTMKLAKTLSEATVTRDQYTRDRFQQYRSRDSASCVGVIMQVRYMVETEPVHRDRDVPSDDAVNTVIYKYDLELNPANRIIGGEWFTGKSHPDFLWTPPPSARAISPAEQMATGTWDADQALPRSWRSAGVSAARDGMPLAKIVEALIRLANG